ncbi:MAG: aromatic-ring-hydroxylating dioxygenase subunit beta [Steroidobacteraceae bacterium]
MPERNVIERVDALQLEYLRALDRRDMGAWAECFGDPASYTCTTSENEEQGLPLALMLDDSRERIADRVNYVTRVWAGTFEDYRMRHFVQRLTCVEQGPSVVAVETQFLVAYTTTRGQSEVLATGIYLDTIALSTKGGAKFRSKKAVLDTAVMPRYLVYPL